MRGIQTDLAKGQNDKAILFQQLFSIRTELERLHDETSDFRKEIASMIYRIDHLIEIMISAYEKSLFD